MKVELYPTPTGAVMVSALLAAIWGILVLYAASTRRARGNYRWAIKEGTSLFLASFVVIALLGVAIAGKFWLSDRLGLNRFERNAVGSLLASALVFPAWVAWSLLRERHRHKHRKRATSNVNEVS